MTTSAFDRFAATIGRPGTRRTVLQTLGAGTFAAGTGLAGLNAASAKKGKKGKKKRRKGAPPAPQDLAACQEVMRSRCLAGDTNCIASGDGCCTLLAAGRTAEAVTCLRRVLSDTI